MSGKVTLSFEMTWDQVNSERVKKLVNKLRNEIDETPYDPGKYACNLCGDIFTYYGCSTTKCGTCQAGESVVKERHCTGCKRILHDRSDYCCECR